MYRGEYMHDTQMFEADSVNFPQRYDAKGVILHYG